MATLTIRQVNERTHAALRERAARNGRSVEAEVRALLDSLAVAPSQNVLLAVRDAAHAAGRVDLVFPSRDDEVRVVDLS